LVPGEVFGSNFVPEHDGTDCLLFFKSIRSRLICSFGSRQFADLYLFQRVIFIQSTNFILLKRLFFINNSFIIFHGRFANCSSVCDASHQFSILPERGFGYRFRSYIS
jgi:hypothetical protein